MQSPGRRALLRALRPALATAVCVVAIVSVLAAPMRASAAPQRVAESAAATPSPMKETRYSFGTPTNVSVSVSESGMTVYGRPDCNVLAFPTCQSYIRLAEVGLDVPRVSTTNGAFIPWPASWKEGRTVSSGTVHSNGRNVFGVWYYGTTGTSLGAITRPYSQRPITARLDRQDDTTRTAYVSGTATPHATIRRDGSVVATADESGAWNASASGLPLGTTTLAFQQYVDGSYRDQAHVSVTFVAKELLTGITGQTTSLPSGSTTVVQANVRATADFTGPLSGTQVTFTAPNGTVFPADLRSIRGQYLSPSGGDWTDFGTDNLVNGSVSADRRTATFTWSTSSGWSVANGTSIRFGIPIDNQSAASGSAELRMSVSGNAPQGALRASTTTPVTFVPGALSPVRLTGPASVSPGERNTFSGTATPGATFEVVDASGLVIVPGGPFTVDEQGRWSFDASVPAGALDYRFAIKQTAFGTTDTSQVFVVPADTRN
jgi:hypothetical protein